MVLHKYHFRSLYLLHYYQIDYLINCYYFPHQNLLGHLNMMYLYLHRLGHLLIDLYLEFHIFLFALLRFGSVFEEFCHLLFLVLLLFSFYFFLINYLLKFKLNK